MPDMLAELERIIADRKANPVTGSYTNKLLEAGCGTISQKVGEEAVEVIVAAMGQGRSQQIGEIADLLYHTLVLMADLELSLDDVQEELARRHQLKSE